MAEPRQNPPLTAERARELLAYDPLTGALTWRINSRTARRGTPAGVVRPRGTRQVQIDGHHYEVHRIIWLMQTGNWPDHLLDHRDTYGPKCDEGNKLENLRQATRADNAHNMSLYSNNISGVAGVGWHKAGGCWTAAIKYHGKRIWLGRFRSFDDAVSARKAAEREYFGEFAPQVPHV